MKFIAPVNEEQLDALSARLYHWSKTPTAHDRLTLARVVDATTGDAYTNATFMVAAVMTAADGALLVASASGDYITIVEEEL